MEEVSRWWREMRNDWPDVWDSCRRRGLVKALPDLAQAVVYTVSMVILLAGIIACDVLRTTWSRAYPLSEHNMDRKERRRKENSLQQLLCRPMGDPISAYRTVQSHELQHGSEAKDSIFCRLPPEIRRQVLISAFGHRTVHMDLNFRVPLNLVEKQPHQGLNVHAKIHRETPVPETYLDTRSGKTRAWRWFGCVCHRFDFDKTPPLACGRRRNYRWAHFAEPDTDLCLHGSGKCNSWPGSWPLKCQIGVMGWMLSCKRAYFEVLDVLYGTNTIHITSPVLMKSMSDLFAGHILANIRSLELVWQCKDLPLVEGFCSRPKDLKCQQPVFPHLVYLRISFARMVIHEVDPVTNIVWPYDNKRLLSERLHTSFLPQIDDLIDRIAPLTTEVTISCAKWDWYDLIDLALLESQGKKATRMQRADIEGLRCWRMIPIRRSISSEDSEPGLSSALGREGYWIHIPIGDMVTTGNERNFMDLARTAFRGVD
ncbi:hypothetical protein ED733_007080 [Metarhizium rileyi]|uniref:DUF7730 domain-containing protein n=1 Tax=Metarhizium rileyi (strain RCEF 4871) TaxID=1649241 RepID=A0A5C6GEV3_METRR|nr:hypothetical protein ED733_007080 [Metarhizium rileyi]